MPFFCYEHRNIEYHLRFWLIVKFSNAQNQLSKNYSFHTRTKKSITLTEKVFNKFSVFSKLQLDATVFSVNAIIYWINSECIDKHFTMHANKTHHSHIFSFTLSSCVCVCAFLLYSNSINVCLPGWSLVCDLYSIGKKDCQNSEAKEYENGVVRVFVSIRIEHWKWCGDKSLLVELTFGQNVLIFISRTHRIQ